MRSQVTADQLGCDAPREESPLAINLYHREHEPEGGGSQSGARYADGQITFPACLLESRITSEAREKNRRGRSKLVCGLPQLRRKIEQRGNARLLCL